MQHQIYLRDSKEPLIVSEGEQYMVEVKGWIMCKKVESGNYRIKIWSKQGSGIATLYKPKGTKPIVSHYLEDLGFMTQNCSDLNGTVILGKYEGKL